MLLAESFSDCVGVTYQYFLYGNTSYLLGTVVKV